MKPIAWSKKSGSNLYRAIDSHDNTLDFMLSAKRDAKAAKRFFKKVLKGAWTVMPRVINVDGPVEAKLSPGAISHG